MYISRDHLKAVWKTAFTRDRVLDDSREAMSYRAALIGVFVGQAALMLFCLAAGMTFWMTLMFFGIFWVFSIGITRVRAELGPPAHEMAGMNATNLLVTVFGSRAVGGPNLAMFTMFYWFTGRGYRSHPMPCQLEALKMGEVSRMNMRGLGAVMLFAMFFLLRDGHTLARQVRDLLPLPDSARDRLMIDTRDLIVASVGAGLVVAAVQGTIGGLAFWLLGIKAAVIWGVVMAVCSLIPLVGATLVWAPTAVWLLLSGEIVRGIILIVVGVFAIGLADNVLRPILLAGRTTASGLVVFLGLLGGAAAFGFIGLVLGPIILVTAGSLLRVFSRREPRTHMG